MKTILTVLHWDTVYKYLYSYSCLCERDLTIHLLHSIIDEKKATSK